MKRIFLRPHIFFTILLFAVISCGGAGNDGGDEGTSVRISLKLPTQGLSQANPTLGAAARQEVGEFSSIRIIIDCEGSPIRVENIDVSELPLEVKFFVPLGTCTFTVVLLDQDGQSLASGTSGEVIISPGENVITILISSIIQRCNDGIDNDGDGLPDCEDPDCQGLMCNVEDPGLVCIDFLCQSPTPTPSPTPTSSPTPTPTPTPTPPSPEIDCNDGLDNDGDNLIDCADPDCEGVDVGEGQVCQIPEESCNDFFDNDGDDLTDCADPDCEGVSVGEGQICQIPEENCSDDFDNDGDGATDCADTDCEGELGPQEQLCEIPEATCNDGSDNDGDGDADCRDSDCDGVDVGEGQVCEFPSEETCNDGFDNDGDGDADCGDPDCDGQLGPIIGLICEILETIFCADGFDNDGDGLADCADPSCVGTGPPGQVCEIPEANCSDDFDNDADGFTDCVDSDCFENPSCFITLGDKYLGHIRVRRFENPR